MRKIKIVELTGHEYCDDDYHGPTIYTLAAFTDWDEVSDEDFEAIRFWVNAQNRNRYGGGKVLLLEEKLPDYPRIVAEYIDKAKEERKKAAELERKQAEKARRRELALQNRKAKAQAKEETKKRELFEKLKKEFEKRGG